MILGIIANQDTSIEMKIQLLSKKTQFLYGARISGKDQTYSLCYGNASNGLGFRSDYYQSLSDMLQRSDLSPQVFKQEKNRFYINGSLAYTHTYANFEAGGEGKKHNLYLFNVNENGNIIQSYGTDLKFYYCKIWDGNTLIRDFIPVLNNQNKVCLYEKVEQKLYDTKYGEQQEEFERDSEKINLNSVVCDGNQYIDTEVKPNQDTIVEMKCKIDEKAGNQALFGSRTTNVKNTFTTFFVKTNNNNIRCDYNTVLTNIEAIEVEKEKVIKQNKNIFYLNGVQKASVNYSNFNGDYNLYLFAVNTSGTVEQKSMLEFYYCKIWSGNVLVRDYIPVMDENSNIYLYDKVNSKSYVSKGSNFVLGGEIKI